MNDTSKSGKDGIGRNYWLHLPVSVLFVQITNVIQASTLSAFNNLRRRFFHVVNIIAQWRLRLVMLDSRFRAWIANVFVSLFAIAIAASILLVTNIRNTIDSFQPLEAILTQLGATYGTILALVLTLSLIPIQRAGEVWSPSIVRLYRRDPVTHITFVVLGIFCIVSFLFAVRGLAGIAVSIVMACSLVILGISVDLLRWYHGHVSRLLDPTHAVRMVLTQVNRSIERARVLVARIAQSQYQLLGMAERNKFSVEDIEATVYSSIPGYTNSIKSLIGDLAEIAIKAVARGERLLAKATVFAVAEVSINYLTSRRQNLTLSPAAEAMFLVSTSDTNVVTNPAYEALKEISRSAVTQGDESTAIRVSEAYQSIAIHAANLGARAIREHSSPLAYAPIFYFLECVKYAQSKGLDEVPFQTAELLSNIAISAPKDVQDTDIHIPVIDGLCEIAVNLYVKRSFGLAEQINGYQFDILAHMLKQRDFYFKDVLRHILEKIELLAPLTIVNETIAGRFSIVHPLGKAYGLTSPNSLGYLFEQAAQIFSRVEVDRDWVNPYLELIEIADIIYDHLRRIANNNEFGSSFIIWDINRLIMHIADVVARLIDKPLRPGRNDEREVVNKLLWILAFYWVAFNGKKTVSKQRADECCESLVYIGLSFFARDYPDVLRSCISNICSILESYCEIAQPPDRYTIGDILAHLWGIRTVLFARKNAAFVQEVDQLLGTKPKALSDEQWQTAQEAIILRREQLEKRLADTNVRRNWQSNAEGILRELLGEAKQPD